MAHYWVRKKYRKIVQMMLIVFGLILFIRLFILKNDESIEIVSHNKEYLDQLQKYVDEWRRGFANGESELVVYGRLLDFTHKLIVLEQPAVEHKVTKRPNQLSDLLDCSNLKYNSFLYPQKLDVSNKILDFILFSYELTMIEIRLFELYDVVDEFVIFESNLTFKYIHKPLFFIENIKRFERFLDKITFITPFNIYKFNKNKVINVADDDIPEAYKKASSKIPKAIIENDKKLFFKEDFYLEDLSRKLPLTHYRKYVRPILDNELILHGDVDEIPDSNILNHFKHCNVRNKYPYSFMSTFHMFKFRFLYKSDFPGDGDPHSLVFPNIYRFSDIRKNELMRTRHGFQLPRASSVHCNRFTSTIAISIYKSMSLSDAQGLDTLFFKTIQKSSKNTYLEIKRLYSSGTALLHAYHLLTYVNFTYIQKNLFIPYIIKEKRQLYSDFF